MSRLRMIAGRAAADSRLWPVALAAVSLIPFVPLLLPNGRGIAVPPASDYSCYQLPTREFARDEILAGRFPLWLPYLACGTPLHATQQASLCYPLLMPLVVVFGAAYGIKLSLFAHLSGCFAGEYLLACKLGVSRPAAGLAALATTWSMQAMNHLAVGHVAMVLGFALVPWFFFALATLLERPGPLPAAGLGAVTACLAVVGHPQLPYYTFVAGACWTAASLIAGAGSTQRVAAGGWFAAAVLLGALLSAVQLAPIAELAKNGTEGPGHGTARRAALWSMDGGDILGLVLPDAKGAALARLPEFEPKSYLHERGAYLGIAALVLAVYSLSRATTARWQRGAAWLCLGASMFAVGESTPFFRYLGAVMPGAFSFRCAGRVFGVIVPLASALAGRGADALARRDPPGTRGQAAFFALWLFTALAFFAGVIWQWLAKIGWHEYLSFALESLGEQLALFEVTVVVTGFVFTFARRSRRAERGTIYLALPVLLGADLYYHNVTRFRLGPSSPRTLPAELAAIQPPVRIAGTPEWPRVRNANLRYSGLAPTAIAARRSALDTFDGGILPGGVDRLYGAIERDPPVALAVAGCNYHFVGSERAWKTIPDALPRIRLLGGEAESLLKLPIEALGKTELSQLREAVMGKLIVFEEDPQRLRLRVEAPRAGALVVADIYYPGWRAKVDGAIVPIDTAHAVFRAVPVSAGIHEITFTFESRSFETGLGISLCGLLLAAIMIGYGWRNRKTAGSLAQEISNVV